MSCPDEVDGGCVVGDRRLPINATPMLLPEPYLHSVKSQSNPRKNRIGVFRNPGGVGNFYVEFWRDG